jgi:conjugative transposon TraJ protein
MMISHKGNTRRIILLVLPILLSAAEASAQATSGVAGLHGVLENLYTEMIPLCSQLIGVARGIAGFAAVWYIGARIWRHLARAEPVDVYPLLRPFALGFCILIFPSVLALLHGILQPTVTATSGMVTRSDAAIAVLLKQKEAALHHTEAWQMYVGPDGQGDPDHWYTYTHPGSDASEAGLFSGLGEDLKFAMAKASYNFRSSVKQWMSEVLEVLFEAAALCIDTLRTFQLVVLSILGPLVFGLAVFDGFQRSLSAWLARYIHIFLWLPVANIFGAIIGRIQEKMLQIDISQVSQQGDTFFSTTDVAYLIFLIIGIVGYFTVPSVAHYIVEAGQNVLGQKVTTLFHHTPRAAMQLASGGSAAAGNWARGRSSPPSSPANTYMASRLQGKGS